MSCLIAKTHERIGNLRREFIHQQTSRLVCLCEVLATEELKVKNMSRRHCGQSRQAVKQKSGLNGELLSLGLSMVHQMLGDKAEEADCRLPLSNTRQLKPSQRYAKCWTLVP